MKKFTEQANFDEETVLNEAVSFKTKAAKADKKRQHRAKRQQKRSSF